MKDLFYTVIFIGVTSCVCCESKKDSESGLGTQGKPTAMSEETEEHEIGTSKNINCELAIKKLNGKIIAELVTKNRSDIIQSFSPWVLMTDGKMTWNAFEVTYKSRKVPYRCTTIKRGPLDPKDTIVLQPKERYNSSIEISSCYDFTQEGMYEIVYGVIEYIAADDVFLSIESNKVKITIP